jgi:hypothetical protein
MTTNTNLMGFVSPESFAAMDQALRAASLARMNGRRSGHMLLRLRRPSRQCAQRCRSCLRSRRRLIGSAVKSARLVGSALG